MGRQFDALDRPQRIGALAQFPQPGDQPTVTDPVALFGFRGVGLKAEATIGRGPTPALHATMDYDDVRRLIGTTYTDPGSRLVMGETIGWTPRSLRATQTRRDENGLGLAFQYDKAERLTEAKRTQSLGLAGLPDRWTFQMDVAQNLTEQRADTSAGVQVTSLPPDASGRNRPGAVNGSTLDWDANGNLIHKGDQRFAYDYRNRLTHVTNASGDVAVYTYDAFNRRVQKVVGSTTEETVWDGWQSIEDYKNGQLATRRTYGLSLDEIVAVDRDSDGNGTIDTTYHPVYDDHGNVVMIVDPTGKPIERYEYSPYGERLVIVNDLTPPSIDQVRVTGGAIWLEASEAVSQSALAAALQAGSISLVNVATSQPIPVTVSEPVSTGRDAWHRIVLTPGNAPATGTSVRLTLAAGTLEDRFGNKTTAANTQTFAWLVGDAVIQDSAAPKVVQISADSGLLRVQLSEEPNLQSATAAIRLDGAASTWSLDTDRYTLTTPAPTVGAAHTLHIGTGRLDLGGSALAQALDQTFTLQGGIDAQLIYSLADPTVLTTSAAGNVYGY